MEKTILCAKIFDLFAVGAEYPWQKQPSFAVFRHQENRKWFCIYMEITADKLGLIGQETVSIINLKAEPMLIGALRQFDGILPAYTFLIAYDTMILAIHLHEFHGFP